MDIFNTDNNNDLWTKPINRLPNYTEEEKQYVNNMANNILLENRNNIISIINKVVNCEITKRKPDLRKQLLIKNQIFSNIIENVSTIVLNMAKETYDNLHTSIYVDIEHIKKTQMNTTEKENIPDLNCNEECISFDELVNINILI